MEFPDEATHVVFSPNGTGPYPSAESIEDSARPGHQSYRWNHLWLADRIYAQDRACGGAVFLGRQEWPMWAQGLIDVRHSHAEGLLGGRAFQVSGRGM